MPQETPPPNSRLYFRQLLAGRDFAKTSPVAAQMVNFAYLIGDRDTGRCLAIDPAWDVASLDEAAEADGMVIEGALATHYHPDHVGGDLMGHPVEGIREILERRSMPIHCQNSEIEWIVKACDVSRSDLVGHDGGDRVKVGSIEIELVHTPGHTPGSQCFLVDGKLVSGDTLFLQGCGRTDLPGSDPDEMYRSLTQRLARVPASTVVYPGHLYDPRPCATMGETRKTNYVFGVSSLEAWRRAF